MKLIKKSKYEIGKRITAMLLAIVLVVGMLPWSDNQVKVSADEILEIITPKENQLVGAGYIEVEWDDSAALSAEYSIYIDDILVGTTNEESYEYYTTTVKMYSIYIVAKYSDGTSNTSNKINFAVTKKGLCVNDEMGKYLEPVEMNIGWYYNWSSYEFSYRAYKDVGYVPMIWGTGSDGNIPQVAAAGYNYLLAYNEPDMGNDVGGSNTDVETVVSHWKNFLGYDFHLGAPAPALSPSWDNGTWFRTFMNSIDTDTVEFIPLHCYYGTWGGKDAANWFLQDVVDKTYEMYKKPIWITEFAISGWGYSDETNKQSVKEFMETVIEGLNEREYVERFSWFSFNTTDEYNGASALWTNATGELTELGKTYVECGNPKGYAPTEQEKLNYSIKESVKNELLPDYVTLEGVTYEDYINGTGVTANASSNYNTTNNASKAIDDNITTRWESVQGVDPQSITIDLGQIRCIKEFDIVWETASAKDYTIEVSDDGKNYTEVALVEGGSSTQNRLDTIVLNKMAKGRYIKINGTSRTTVYGYSIFDLAVYGAGSVEDNIYVDVLGFQYNTAIDGYRVISAVESNLINEEIIEYGNVYGMIRGGLTEENIVVGSSNSYVKSFASTAAGLTNVKYADSDTAVNYIMTMINNGYTVEAYTQNYMVKAYAKLSDGTYIYSDAQKFSIYEIADCLYKKQKMGTESQHNYLYENILCPVNPNYEVVKFDWERNVVNN